MDLHLRGKSVLITGASKGIGAATAEAFAEEGSNVHLAARSTFPEARLRKSTRRHGVTPGS
jgi:NAD(P)-dependent dehydrogenase (short-subunit alcohol dehydrogenase family)